MTDWGPQTEDLEKIFMLVTNITATQVSTAISEFGRHTADGPIMAEQAVGTAAKHYGRYGSLRKLLSQAELLPEIDAIRAPVYDALMAVYMRDKVAPGRGFTPADYYLLVTPLAHGLGFKLKDRW
jgi:hypothetical protein